MNLINKISIILLLIIPGMHAHALEYIVQPGDSVNKILREQGFSGDRQQIYHEVNKVFSLNPDAFIKRNPDRLIPGARLELSEYRPVVEVKPVAAPVPVRPPEAGHIIIEKGIVNIIRNNASLQADTDSELYSGDTLITSANTITQLKMLDGSLFELGPNTEFSLDKFSLPDSTTNSNSQSSIIDKTGQVITTLIKGVARIVTGKIGQNDRSRFVTQTSIASIGIRGTDYTLRYCEADCGQLKGTSVAVIDGGINLNNEAGQVELKKGEFARAESASSIPFSAPMPEGFLNLSIDVAQIEPQEDSWWKRLKGNVTSWFE